MRSLGKTLLAFALLHSILQGQIYLLLQVFLGLPWWLRQQSVCLQCRRPGFDSSVGKIPWRRKWQSTTALLPGKSHGWRRLAGYSLWGRKWLDVTEQLHSHQHGCGLAILLKSSHSYNARTASKEERTKRKRQDGLSTIPLDKKVSPVLQNPDYGKPLFLVCNHMFTLQTGRAQRDTWKTRTWWTATCPAACIPPVQR